MGLCSPFLFFLERNKKAVSSRRKSLDTTPRDTVRPSPSSVQEASSDPFVQMLAVPDFFKALQFSMKMFSQCLDEMESSSDRNKFRERYHRHGRRSRSRSPLSSRLLRSSRSYDVSPSEERCPSLYVSVPKSRFDIDDPSDFKSDHLTV